MKKYFKIAEALSSWDGFSRRSTALRVAHRGRKALEARRLNLEQLEERQLLAVSAFEYDAIRAMYTGLDLAESSDSVKLIEIEANKLTSESLWRAIDEAQKSAEDDLIVIRTSDKYNTMALGSGTMEINLDSAHYGSLSIVGYGSQMLQITGVEAPLLSISGGTVNIGGLTFLGMTTDGTISTRDLVNVAEGASLTTSRVLYMTQFGENLSDITASNILKTGSYSLAEDMVNPAICSVEFQVDGSTWAFMTGINAQDSSDYQRAIYSAQYPTEVVWFDANKTWDTDWLLCWAASTSNMLCYTKWANQTIDSSFTNEQKVFEYFKDHFTDWGGSAYYGVDWFLTGNYEVKGDPEWSQPTKDGGAFYQDFVTNIDDYRDSYFIDSDDQILVNLEARLREYCGIGLGIGGSLAHAITCWGYLYDTEIDKNTPEYYTGLILTDSDDNQYKYFTADVVWVPETETEYGYYDMNNYYPGAILWEVISLDRYEKQEIATPAVRSNGPLDDVSIQIEIAQVAGATGYTVEWAASSDFANAYSAVTDTAGPYTISGLRANTEYFVRVRANANDIFAASEWSSVISVTTLDSQLPSIDDPLFSLTDGNDANNKFYYTGSSSSWICGTDDNETGVISDIYTVLQNEAKEASITFEALGSWETGFKCLIAGENADEYWDGGQRVGDIWLVDGNTATWNANGLTSPKREFTFVAWNDIDGNNVVDSGEESYSFIVSVQWANISICVDQPVPGEGDEIFQFRYDADFNVNEYDAGHGFWDNRTTEALLNSGIINAGLYKFANVSEGYGASLWGAEAIRQFIEYGNFICDGRTQLSSDPNHSLANWDTVDVHKTFTIKSLSDYLALLNYNKEIYTAPPRYVQMPQDGYTDPETGEHHEEFIDEMQCMVAAMDALRAAGFTVESYPQGGSPAGTADFEYEWTEELVEINNNGTWYRIDYTGTSPAHVGQDLFRDGGVYTFGKDETGKENKPFNGDALNDRGFPKPTDNGSYSVGDMREFLGWLKDNVDNMDEGERAALEEYVLQLSSYSKGEYVIYLDFDGDNSDQNYRNGKIPRYSHDADEMRDYFTAPELLSMYEAWLTASEDFAPFNINVTLRRDVYEAADPTLRFRGIIGGTSDDWLGSGPLEQPVGGISGANPVFENGDDYPDETLAFYVFAQGKKDGVEIGNTITHEAGHSFDYVDLDTGDDVRLLHQSQPNIEYYPGNDEWSAIMGGGSAKLTQWSKGEFPKACIGNYGTFTPVGVVQDDIKIIRDALTVKGINPLRKDQNNIDIYTAKYLDFSKVTETSGEISVAEGIIGGYWDDANYTNTIFEDNEDADYFMFEITGDEAYHFNIGGIVGDGITNLDVRANIYNAAGELLDTYNTGNSLAIEFDFGGQAGVYYLSVFGTGKETETAGVYSDYGSLGMYDIRVTKGTILRVNDSLSLASAIQQVNAMSDAQVAFIYFEEAGTYYHTDELVLTHSVSFMAEGKDVTISGRGSHRVMTIGKAGDANELISENDDANEVKIKVKVKFDGITISGGNADLGGGLYIHENADVTFVNSKLLSNTATKAGGAVYVDGGSFAIFGGVVSSNSANEAGAGVYFKSGNFTVNDVTNTEFYQVSAQTRFSGNVIDNDDFESNAFNFGRYEYAFGNARGGAIHVSTGTASINAATFSSNQVIGWFSQGAGLYVDTDGVVSVTDSTFSSNVSDGNSAASYDVSGAGIYVNYGGTVTLKDSVVSSNTAQSNGSAGVVSVEDAGGAGLYADGTLTVINSSVRSNKIEINSALGRRVGGNGQGSRIGGAGIGGLNGTVTVIDSDVTSNTIAINVDIASGVNQKAIGGAGIGLYGGTLTITDSEITNNSLKSRNGAIGIGGGIGTAGELALTNSMVKSNTGVANGGGIYVMDGEATISASNIRDNTAAQAGAGVYSDNATMQIVDSTYIVHNALTSNEAGYGAGIYVNGGEFYLKKSFVEYNTLDTVGNGAGAGVYITNLKARDSIKVEERRDWANISETYIYGNIMNVHSASSAVGGGVFANSSDFLMASSEVSGNVIEANGTGAITAAGAGVYMLGGKMESMTVNQNSLSAITTAAGSSLSVYGGGIYAHGLIVSTLVAQNYLYALGAGDNTSLPRAGGAGVSSAVSGGQLTIQNATITENMGFSQWNMANPFYVSVAGVTSASPAYDLVMHNSIVIRNSMTDIGTERSAIQTAPRQEYFEWLGVDVAQAREIYRLINPGITEEELNIWYTAWLEDPIYKDQGTRQNPYARFELWEKRLYEGNVSVNPAYTYAGDYCAAAFAGVLAEIQAALDNVAARVAVIRAENLPEGQLGHKTDAEIDLIEAGLITEVNDTWKQKTSINTGSSSHDISVVGLGSAVRSWIYGHNNYTGSDDWWPGSVEADMTPQEYDFYFATSLWRHTQEIRYGQPILRSDTSRNNEFYIYGVHVSPFLLDGDFDNNAIPGNAFDTDVFHWTLGDYHIDNNAATAVHILEQGDINYLGKEGIGKTDAWGGNRLLEVVIDPINEQYEYFLDIGAFQWQTDGLTVDDETDITITSLRDYVNPNDGIITIREALGGYTSGGTEVFGGYATSNATIEFDTDLRGGTFTPNYQQYYAKNTPCYYDGSASAYLGSLYLTKSVTIDGVAADDPNEVHFTPGITFLTGGNSNAAFVMVGDGKNVELRSVAVESFYGNVAAPRTPREDESSYWSYGSGIVSRLTDHSAILIKDSTFTGLTHTSGSVDPQSRFVNRSDGPSKGAAIHHEGVATIRMDNTKFVNNRITNFSVGMGGAVYIEGAENGLANVELSGVTFKDNYVETFCEAYGGALYLKDAHLTIDDEAWKEIEGIVYYESECTPEEWANLDGPIHYDYSSFVNNRAVADATRDDRDITNDDTNHIGPRLAMPTGFTQFSNDNTVFAYGGAVFVGATDENIDVTLNGVTFDGNKVSATADYDEKNPRTIYNATAGGGGIYLGKTVSLTATARDNENESDSEYWTVPKATSFTNNASAAKVEYSNPTLAALDANAGNYRTATAAGGGIGFAGTLAVLYGVEVDGNKVSATSEYGQSFSYGGGMQSCGQGRLVISNFVYGFRDSNSVDGYKEQTAEIETSFDNNSVVSTGRYGAESYGGGLSNFTFDFSEYESLGGAAGAIIEIDNTSFSSNKVEAEAADGFAQSLGGGLYNQGALNIYETENYRRLTKYDDTGNDKPNTNGWFKSGREKFDQQFNLLFNDNSVTASGSKKFVRPGDPEVASLASGGGLFIAEYNNYTTTERVPSNFEYELLNIRADNNIVQASAYFDEESASNDDEEERGHLIAIGGGVALADTGAKSFVFNGSSASGNTVTAISRQEESGDENDQRVYEETIVYGGGVYAGAIATSIEQSRAASNLATSQAVEESVAHGGGLYNEGFPVLNPVTGEYESTLAIWRGRFVGNTLTATTEAFGGGVYFTGAGKLYFSGSSFVGANSVSATNAFGGGVYTDSKAVKDIPDPNDPSVDIPVTVGAELTIDCSREGMLLDEYTLIEAQFDRIYLNQAAGDKDSKVDYRGRGGGIYKEGGEDLTIIDSTHVYQNFASDNGGGVWVRGGNNIEISKKAEFYDNKAGSYVVQDGEVTYVSGYGGGIFSRENVGEFKIDDAKFDRNFAGQDGGAVHNENAANLTVINSKFYDNKADHYGGAIYNINNNELSVNDSTFERNEAKERGGAIYDNNHKLQVNGSEFAFNKATAQNGYGGAIAVIGFTVTEVSESHFEANSAYGAGGAIYNFSKGEHNVDPYEGFALVVLNSDFIQNITTGADYGIGGAIYNQRGGLMLKSEKEKGNQFLLNSAAHSGGAIYNQQGVVEIENYNFDSNQAEKSGGAIYNKNENNDNITLNATVAGIGLTNNKAGVEGGAIYNIGLERGTLAITNYSINANSAGGDGGAVYNYATTELTIVKNAQVPEAQLEISNNISGADGGAIWTRGFLTIRRYNLIANTAARNGGAIYIKTPNNVGSHRLIVTGGDISSNNAGAKYDDNFVLTSSAFGGSGGAIYVKTIGSQNTRLNVKSIVDNMAWGAVDSSAPNVPEAAGGAIWITADGNSTLNMKAVHELSRNSAMAGDGGAVYVSTKGNQTFSLGNADDSVYADMEGNRAKSVNSASSNTKGSGGALYLAALGNQNTTIAGELLTDNIAALSGGAIYRTGIGGSVTLTGDVNGAGLLSRNIAEQGSGGAIYSDRGSITVTNFQIGELDLDLLANGNMAKLDGGAIYSSDSGDVNVIAEEGFENNFILGNVAFGEEYLEEIVFGNGGFLYAGGGGVNVTGYKVIAGNVAGDSGGAIYSTNGSITVTTENDGDILGNIAETGDGGFLYSSHSAATVTGYDFEDNSAGDSGGAIYSVGIGELNVRKEADAKTGGNASSNHATAGNGGFAYSENGNVNIVGYDFANNAAGLNGGAIYSGGDYNVTILHWKPGVANALATKNEAIDGSGGFAYASGGDMTVLYYDLTDNSAAENGGALYQNSGKLRLNYLYNKEDARAADPKTIYTVSGNSALNGSGGAVYVNDGNFFTATVDAHHNSAKVSGGAFYLDSGAASETFICLSDISENTAVVSGGGIYQGAAAKLELDNVLVSDNTLSGGNAKGAGIYNAAAAGNYYHSTIAGNSMADGSQGGGVYVDGGVNTFTNTIIALNEAAEGAQIFKDNGAEINAVYSVSSKDVDWTTFDEHSLVYDNDEDPFEIFISPHDGNYRPFDYCPVVKAGDPNAAVITKKDLDGNDRITQIDLVCRTNMGVYETSGSAEIPKTQTVYGEKKQYTIANGGSQKIDVWHKASTYDSDGKMTKVKTLGLNVYFNSNLLEFNDNVSPSEYLTQDALISPVTEKFFNIMDDLDNKDGDPTTDKYIRVNWNNYALWGEGALAREFEILGLVFSAKPVSVEKTTRINFTIEAITWQFQGVTESIAITISPPNFDVDGNGFVDLNDVGMINRYFDAEKNDTLPALEDNGLDDLIDKRACRKTTKEVMTYIENNRSIFNITGDKDFKSKDEIITSDLDGELLRRYIADFTGCDLIAALNFKAGTLRKDNESITKYIESYLPDPNVFVAPTEGSLYQIISAEAGSSLNGKPFDVTVSHRLYSEDTAASLSAGSLSLRIHYNSKVIGFDAENKSNWEFLLAGGIEILPRDVIVRVMCDKENFDSDGQTDKYIWVSWNITDGSLNSAPALFEKLFRATFTVVDPNAVTTTRINFTAADLAANYKFSGWDPINEAPTYQDPSVFVTTVKMSFDFDSDGELWVQSDLNLWQRMIFRGDSITPEQLVYEISAGDPQETYDAFKYNEWGNPDSEIVKMLDINKDGKVSEDDARRLYLYLGGFDMKHVVEGLYKTETMPDAPYETEQEAIDGTSAHFAKYGVTRDFGGLIFSGFGADMSAEGEFEPGEMITVLGKNDFASALTDLFAPEAPGQEGAAPKFGYDELPIALLDEAFVSDEDDWDDALGLDLFIEEMTDDAPETAFDTDPLAILLTE